MRPNCPFRSASILIRILIGCSVFPVLTSCEPRDEKNSRLAVETYSLMLNSVIGSVVEAKAEEGLPDRSPDVLYSPVIDRISEIDAGLAGFKFTADYLPFSESQRQVAGQLKLYLESRMQSFISMNATLSCYESASLIRAEMEEHKKVYSDNIDRMDSASAWLDSIISGYNLRAEGSRLREKIILPPSFHDTVNDFLLNKRTYILSLQPGSPGS